jgi:hypothetical protein
MEELTGMPRRRLPVGGHALRRAAMLRECFSQSPARHQRATTSNEAPIRHQQAVDMQPAQGLNSTTQSSSDESTIPLHSPPTSTGNVNNRETGIRFALKTPRPQPHSEPKSLQPSSRPPSLCSSKYRLNFNPHRSRPSRALPQ